MILVSYESQCLRIDMSRNGTISKKRSGKVLFILELEVKDLLSILKEL